MNKLFEYDLEIARGVNGLIAGIDEAGRGPLAGPVSAACVIMPLTDPIEGVNDSKKLSESARERLYKEIIAKAVCYKCVMVDNETIDNINILNATKRAMLEALRGLRKEPELVLIDAVRLNSGMCEKPIIHGDALSYSIAAASIIAKVERDRLMYEYDMLYPEYGFGRHKGYGTALHIERLKQYGPLPVHRKTFITNLLNGDKYDCGDDE